MTHSLTIRVNWCSQWVERKEFVMKIRWSYRNFSVVTKETNPSTMRSLLTLVFFSLFHSLDYIWRMWWKRRRVELLHHSIFKKYLVNKKSSIASWKLKRSIYFETRSREWSKHINRVFLSSFPGGLHTHHIIYEFVCSATTLVSTHLLSLLSWN